MAPLESLMCDATIWNMTLARAKTRANKTFLVDASLMIVAYDHQNILLWYWPLEHHLQPSIEQHILHNNAGKQLSLAATIVLLTLVLKK